jgi:hypothetical protein
MHQTHSSAVRRAFADVVGQEKAAIDVSRSVEWVKAKLPHVIVEFPDGYRRVARPKGQRPRWVKLFVWYHRIEVCVGSITWKGLTKAYNAESVIKL